MKKLIAVLIVFSIAAVMCACGAASPKITEPEGFAQFSDPKEGDTIAVFTTSKGTFKALLFPQYAPNTVANFIALAESGYYNGLPFHRVVGNLLVQSGDADGTGVGGKSSAGSPVANEFSASLHNFTGALGMAGGEAGNMSQFYAVTVASLSDADVARMEASTMDAGLISAYKLALGAPHLDFRYTVFGQVYEGLDVLFAINSVSVDGLHRPNSDIILKTVTIETYSAAK